MDHDDVQDAQIEMMREILARGDTFTFRAFGSSMFPMIPPGTEVTVRPLRTVPPPLGTVLVAERDGTLVCHRLVRLGREDRRWIYHLRGDNHLTEDPPFDQERILGEVESIRFGKLGLSADFMPLKLTGGLWAMFPKPARLGVRLLRNALAPLKRTLETAHGRLRRHALAPARIREVEPDRLGSFQARAVHLGLAWNRERTSRLRDDIAQGRALLLEAERDDRLEGSLLVVTGEIASQGWLEFLRLAYPRRGTDLDTDLVEHAIDRLPALGFRTLLAENDRPLPARRLRRLGFRQRERLRPGVWTWSRRL
jgi:hypothetical protein